GGDAAEPAAPQHGRAHPVVPPDGRTARTLGPPLAARVRTGVPRPRRGRLPPGARAPPLAGRRQRPLPGKAPEHLDRHRRRPSRPRRISSPLPRPPTPEILPDAGSKPIQAADGGAVSPMTSR